MERVGGRERGPVKSNHDSLSEKTEESGTEGSEGKGRSESRPSGERPEPGIFSPVPPGPVPALAQDERGNGGVRTISICHAYPSYNLSTPEKKIKA